VCPHQSNVDRGKYETVLDAWLRRVERTASKDQHKLRATRGSIDLLVLITSYWSLEAPGQIRHAQRIRFTRFVKIECVPDVRKSENAIRARDPKVLASTNTRSGMLQCMMTLSLLLSESHDPARSLLLVWKSVIAKVGLVHPIQEQLVYLRCLW
jgi:hypothetical protein